MNVRAILGLTALAAGGAYVLNRKFALKEDLDWATVEKPGEIVYIDGYGVHYIDRGHGPVVLLLHGFGGQTYSYRNLMPMLEREHRVIAVDLKGFGYSERDATAGFSGTAQVAMLKALLERCAVDRAVVVGHSMGGGVALRLASTHPELVRALVLAASVSGEERVGGRSMRPGRRTTPPVRIMRPLLPLIGAFASSRLLQMMYYDDSKISDEVRAEYLRPARIKGSMDGLMAMMRDRAADPPVDDTRVTMPVLLLSGAHDSVVPLDAAQRLRERLPHAKLVVIERAAHGLLEEQPEACFDAIDRFLREAGVKPSSAPAAT
jgi:pimeloyl-ACP methyl ester carboxylesterase